MRYSGSGQNFVQARNMGGGGQSRLGAMISNYYGMRSRAELITHSTDEGIRRDEANNRSKTIYDAVGTEIGGQIKRKAVGSDYDMFNETFQDENDPRLKVNRGKDSNGNLIYPKVGDTVRPELRQHSQDAGTINSSASASGITFGNTAGKDIQAMREARDLKTRTENNLAIADSASSDNNNPTPTDTGGTKPKRKSSGNPTLPQVRAGVKSGNINEEEAADLLNVNSRNNEFKNGGNK